MTFFLPCGNERLSHSIQNLSWFWIVSLSSHLLVPRVMSNHQVLQITTDAHNCLWYGWHQHNHVSLFSHLLPLNWVYPSIPSTRREMLFVWSKHSYWSCIVEELGECCCSVDQLVYHFRKKTWWTYQGQNLYRDYLDREWDRLHFASSSNSCHCRLRCVQLVLEYHSWSVLFFWVLLHKFRLSIPLPCHILYSTHTPRGMGCP